jgi:hypothetical protein
MPFAATQKKIFALFAALILLTSLLLSTKVVHAASANAFISPSGIGVYKNNVLTVGVYENSVSDPVNGASLFISYPAAYFKVSNSDVRNSPGFTIAAATNTSTPGLIQIDRGVSPGHPLTGTQLVATIDFHAVASGVAIPIAFDTGSTNVITSDADNSNIYSGGTGANFALYDPIATGTYMIMNAGNGAFSSRYLNNGMAQETSLGDAKAIAVGGNNMMLISGCGAAYASSASGSGWSKKTACGDAKAVAVGSDGVMMIISGCGAAYAAPDAKAISVGGKNVALITGNDTAYASTSWNGRWSQLTGAGDAKAISISSGGITMLTTACGASYATSSLGVGGWSQKTACGDTKAIATGGSKVGVINNSNTAYASNSWNGGLTQISNTGDAVALSLGDTTPNLIITGCGAAYGNLGLSVGGYNQITICGDTHAIAG